MSDLIIENLKEIKKKLEKHDKKLDAIKSTLDIRVYKCEKQFIKKPTLFGISLLAGIITAIISIAAASSY